MNVVREGRDFWASPLESELTEAVVHDYPRGANEGTLHYIERIAILAGLMPPSRAAFADNATLGQTKFPDVRLPYREVGDDY